MITLAFDTCLDKMYVALKKDERFLSSQIVENKEGKYHSAFLISTLKEVLLKNNLKPENIDVIATNIGPGSFTGIRACTTVARVMAQQLGCKTVGVSSLEILSKLADKNPLVALDARKNSSYLYLNGEIKGAVNNDEIKSLIQSGDYEVITDDKMLEFFGGKSYQNTTLNLGEILIDVALEKLFIQEYDCDWRKLKPLYIQPPPMGC